MASQAAAVDIAEGIKDKIASFDLSEEDYTLERSYADWDLELKDMDGFELSDDEKLRVDVVIHTTQQEAELATRGTVQFNVPLDVAIRRKFGRDKQDETTGRIAVEYIDQLMLFTQEMHLELTKLRMVSEEELRGIWQSTTLLANPVRQHLRELRQFTSIIRILFRADVALG